MKCFSRYLPYIFRPPSIILSSTCHAEVKVKVSWDLQNIRDTVSPSGPRLVDQEHIYSMSLSSPMSDK
ncbi:hypothetical protein Baya_14134 [Bagarius yarrelli]|uniref:Uncharacterized protein n=1 Tax=Bagarius yarrelli TaxID=175774 RepID=A0A556V7P5_BAGYA|nr:hypothetical protein Baya_14134 [Bagarius yarrelli]